jgi:hypothetical protein
MSEFRYALSVYVKPNFNRRIVLAGPFNSWWVEPSRRDLERCAERLDDEPSIRYPRAIGTVLTESRGNNERKKHDVKSVRVA